VVKKQKPEFLAERSESTEASSAGCAGKTILCVLCELCERTGLSVLTLLYAYSSESETISAPVTRTSSAGVRRIMALRSPPPP